MLTLANILLATDQEVFRKLSKYRPDLFKIDNNNKEFIKIMGTISGGKSPQNASIKLYDNNISPSSRCVVSCSCNMFKYKLEAALALQGSAELLHAEPLLADETNPTMKPGLCPHLAFLAKLATAAKTQQDTKIKPKISNKLKKR